MIPINIYGSSRAAAYRESSSRRTSSRGVSNNCASGFRPTILVCLGDTDNSVDQCQCQSHQLIAVAGSGAIKADCQSDWHNEIEYVLWSVGRPMVLVVGVGGSDEEDQWQKVSLEKFQLKQSFPHQKHFQSFVIIFNFPSKFHNLKATFTISRIRRRLYISGVVN